MKLKSITFRCSPAQFSRLEDSLRRSSIGTRTLALSYALEEFLSFVEQKEMRELDLFSLVQLVDREGQGPPFSEQA